MNKKKEYEKENRINQLIGFNEYMYNTGSLGKRLRKNRKRYEEATLTSPSDSDDSLLSQSDDINIDIDLLKDEIKSNKLSINKYHHLFANFCKQTGVESDNGGALASDVTLILVFVFKDIREYTKYIYNTNLRTNLDLGHSRYMDQCLIPSISKHYEGSIKINHDLSCKVQNHVMNIIYNNHVMYNKKDQSKFLDNLKKLRQYFLSHQIAYVLETLTNLTNLLTLSNPNGSRYCLNGKFPVNKHDTLMALRARYTVVSQITEYLKHLTSKLVKKHKDNIKLLSRHITTLKARVKN